MSTLNWSGQVHPEPCTFLLGADETTNQPVTMTFGTEFDKGECPHLWVAGGAATGKTELLVLLASQAALKGWDVITVDTSPTGISHSAGNPVGARALTFTGVDAQGDSNLLVEFVNLGQELNRRTELLQAHGVETIAQLPSAVTAGLTGGKPVRPMLVLIDTVTAGMLAEHKFDISYLAGWESFGAGIHLVVTASGTTAGSLLVSSPFRGRIHLGEASEEVLKQTLGAMSAQIAPAAPGRAGTGLYTYGPGKPVTAFRAYLAPSA